MASCDRATIVVVDGHAAVLELMDQALRNAGHHVLVTSEAREVLELARRVHIDVLVADRALLDRTDSSLVRKLQLAQPDLRLLDLGAPFSLERLTEAVAQLLAGQRAERAA
jgi:DNA-binding NtrC family response regulator